MESRLLDKKFSFFNLPMGLGLGLFLAAQVSFAALDPQLTTAGSAGWAWFWAGMFLLALLALGAVLALSAGWITLPFELPLEKLGLAAGPDEPGDEDTMIPQPVETLSIDYGETPEADWTASADYFETLLGSMSEAVIICDPGGTITRVNRAACDLLAYSLEELVGQNLQDLFAPGHKSDYIAQASITTPRETVFKTPDGEDIPISFTRSVIQTDDPTLAGTIIVGRNITERKKAERRVRYLARYDALTRVANRMQFQHLLQRGIARMKRKKQWLAMIYLDLDRFKDINDTFGHLAGDRTLETISRRLMQSQARDTVIGRLAGDEFALILDGLSPGDDIKARVANTARSLLQELARTFRLKEHEVCMTASAGIAFYPQDASNVIDLIRNADAAMYHAKQNGGNRFEFYDPEMNADEVDRLMLKSQLRRALEREELDLQYQPKIDLRDGKVVGAEALVRWHSAEHGDVPPSVFIPMAEESDLILDIGEWVLNKVCADYKSWISSVPRPGRVAVNLSLKQLRQVKIIQRIKSIVLEHGISPTCLELEITETTLMRDAEKTLKLLDELYGLGLHLSIDDFGTGYSSLSALQQFPISTLKIDKSFVRDAAVDSDDATIVKTIIDMGRSLEMEVVAEGVENEEQLSFLRQQDCTYAQGHLFGDPMVASKFLDLLIAQADGTDTHRALFA